MTTDFAIANPSHRKSTHREAIRSGVTVIELVAVISIITILVSVLLPAVQAAREAMRRTQCSNQIRQMALGVHLFHDAHGIVPTNGGPADDSTLTGASGQAVQPFTYELGTQQKFLWGVADPTRAPKDQTGSWLYSVLPYVERVPEYQQVAFPVEIEVYRCPSRSRSKPMVPDTDEYGVYEGAGLRFSKADYAGNDLLMTGRSGGFRFSSITDGLSHTVMMGEKAHDLQVHFGSSWFWDEPFWLGGSKGTARSGGKIVADGVGIEFRENWGSAHASGAHFAFADGRVVYVSGSVSEELLKAAMTINQSDERWVD